MSGGFVDEAYDYVVKNGIDLGDCSIIANPNPNKYRIRINHKKIRPIYEKYKVYLQNNGLLRGENVSDTQRREFDTVIYTVMTMKNKRRKND